MSFEVWITFVGAATLMLLVPGPTMLHVVSHSLKTRRGQNHVLIAGVVAGHFACLILSLFGLGALQALSPQLMIIVTWACGIYVIFLGVQLVCKSLTIARTLPTNCDRTSFRLFASTFLVVALNPKTLVFLIALLPLFVSGRDVSMVQFSILGMTFLVLSTTVSAAYSNLASWAGQLLSSQIARLRLNIVCGALMSALGLFVLLNASEFR